MDIEGEDMRTLDAKVSGRSSVLGLWEGLEARMSNGEGT